MDELAATPPATTAPSFEALLLPLLPRVRRYAHRLAGNAADGDDLVQATYLDALKGWHTFRPGSDPARWLFTICRHAFYRTRRRAAANLPLENPELESLAATLWMRGELERGRARWDEQPDLREAIDTAIGALPEELRVLVLLVDVEGYSYAEAAAQEAIPVGTVRSRLYRARRLLQEALAAHAEDLGITGGDR